MNKMIKLPLFLAAVCIISTGLLATVDAITAPIISQHETEAKNAGYLKMLGLSNLDGKNIATVVLTATDALSAKGLTAKTTVTLKSDSSIFGVVYDGSVSGYGSDPIVFQVGFVGGYYSGFNCISQSETASVGKAKVLDNLNTYLIGTDNVLSTNVLATTDFTVSQDYSTMTAGATYTKTDLDKAMLAAAADYVASI